MLDFKNCYQQLTKKSGYIFHKYIFDIMNFMKININNIENKEEIYTIDKLDDDLIDYLIKEKYGLYNTFNNYKFKKLNEQMLKNDHTIFIKIFNKIINNIYGIKLKKINKTNDYYLSTNNIWDDLPHKNIITKEINNYNKKYKQKNNNIINYLEIGIDSDDE